MIPPAGVLNLLDELLVGFENHGLRASLVAQLRGDYRFRA